MCDERHVAKDHKDSNFGAISQKLLQEVDNCVKDIVVKWGW